MIISRIDTTNLEYFENLLPEEWARKLTLPSVFALGVLAEQPDGGKQPAGTLVFSVEQGTAGPDVLIAATIQWLYVAPPFRGGQAADALMRAFWNIADQSGIVHILCDVPLPAEYDSLHAYLASWNFRFEMTDRYELVLPLQQITTLPALRQAPRTSVLPLAQVRQADFQHYMLQAHALPNVLQELSQFIADYDSQVSCVHAEEGVIRSALLVQQVSSNMLEIKLLQALAPQQSLGDLCRFAAHAAAAHYPPEMLVRIVCRHDSAAQLIDRLFPDMQPQLVRRGYYFNGPQTSGEPEQDSPADTSVR